MIRRWRAGSARTTNAPVLKWQYIIFGFNENEIVEARKMAWNLNMIFNLKLNWDDLGQ